MKFTPFEMERWQSLHENHVEYNLSESGVHPLTVGELLSLSHGDESLDDVLLGYGQTDGTPPLKHAIANLYPGTSDRSLMVTVGGAEANFVSCWHLVEPGQPAAVMMPNYQQVPGLVESLGGKVLPFYLREDWGWRPDLDQLADALEKGARFVALTNPNNPTGVVLTEREMDDIVALADRYGAWLLADEVYRGAELHGDTTPSFWGRYDRLLVTNSLSKAYGLPGLRVGWVLGPEGVISELWGRTDYTTIGPAAVSDRLATIALSPAVRPKIIERTRSILRSNLAVLESWMDTHPGLFEHRTPEAGALCVVRYNAPISSIDLAERVRVRQRTLVVPGSQFGLEHTLRIGFGIDDLEEGLGRLSDGFNEVSAT